jgi:glycosyltransferase involved in cell wall biosynthesis
VSSKTSFKLNSLSVFFPVYNEEKNLSILIKQALEIIPTVAKKFELIIINDGSQDKSLEVAKKLAQKHPEIKIVSHPVNLGYGAALRSGINAANYEWIFFTDSDLQFDLKQIVDFIPYTKTDQVIIGYRKKRAEGFHRSLNATIFKIYIDLLFRLHVKDIDCAFKLLKADLVKNLRLESSGAFTTSEILYKLKKKRIKFKQLPVDHFPRKYGNSTGANLKVIVKGVWEALALYLKIKLKTLLK